MGGRGGSSGLSGGGGIPKMPQLQGSEKQVKWAEDIRQKKISGLSEINPDSENFKINLAVRIRDALNKFGYGEYMPDAQKRDKAELMQKLKNMYADSMNKMSKINSAKWFIDRRYDTGAMSTIPALFPDKKKTGKGFGW